MSDSLNLAGGLLCSEGAAGVSLVKELDEPMPPLKDYPRITGFKQK